MVIRLDISTPRIVRTLGYMTVAVMIALLAYYVRGALAVLVVAGFIAVAVHAPVSWLARYIPWHSRRIAAAIVLTLIGAVVAFVVNLLVPLVAVQGRELLNNLPVLLADLESMDGALGRWFSQLDLVNQLETALSGVLLGIIYSAETTITVLRSAAAGVLNVLFAIAIGFLLAVHAPALLRQVDSLLPERYLQHFVPLRRRMYRAVSGFVNGQLIITSIAATLTFILLTILGVPAPLSLAAVIWLTGLIPLVGNTLGAVIVIAVALSHSLWIAIFLVAYYLVYQQVENNVLEPIIQSHTTKLTPLIVLASAVVGIHLAGFVGALLAIPAGACLRVTLEYAIEVRQASDTEATV